MQVGTKETLDHFEISGILQPQIFVVICPMSVIQLYGFCGRFLK